MKTHAHIADDLQHLATPIGELVIDPDNARIHNLPSIRDSLMEFGQDQVVVYRAADKVVVKGNGRLQAAIELGWTHVAAIGVDEDQARALYRGVMDNRAGDLALWDTKRLSEQLKRLRDAGFAIEPQWDSQKVSKAREASREVLRNQAPEPSKLKAIAVTEDQMAVIMEAVNRIRASEQRQDLKVGRCIELICADWLAGK